MSGTKHSPLPWKQDGVSVLDAKGHEVAETWGNQLAKMVLPDAAFIVTAVNAHDKLTADRDALLKALKEALCWFGNGCSAAAAGAQCDTMYEAQEQGKAAIAQAKEQP
jgi:hypothetical protein